MGIQWNRDRCYACRMCQLVCSFHHTGRFWPDKSSIDVYRKPTEGTIVWRIEDSCDHCQDEPEPLCVTHCKYAALRFAEEA
jgi:Fe-S-cluster-containing hydrogenase component 2